MGAVEGAVPSYRLISFETCPFVQRAAIVLRAKSVPYAIEYIDLANRPAWFKALSPLGKVPLLQVDGQHVLFESQVIAEYLEETEPPPMHPTSALRRAQHRAYIEVVSTALGLAWRVTVAPTKDEIDALVVQLGALLQRLEHAHGGTTFFDGGSLALIDAAAAPLLQRLTWVDETAELGIVSGLPKLAAWRDALVDHPAVVAAAIPDLRARAIAHYQGWMGAQVTGN